MPFWDRSRKQPVDSDAERTARIVAQHLPPDLAAAYMALARPAVHLRKATDAQPVVGQLGGLPRLEGDAEWPAWAEHGPLSFVASLDCAALSNHDAAGVLPTEGHLLFFYWDGQLDQGVDTVGYWEPATLAGARVLHVPAGPGLALRSTAEPLVPYPEVPLTATPILTFPSWDHPDLEAAFMEPRAEPRAWLEHPVNADAFVRALDERLPGPRHQVGGYAGQIQGPVEVEVAQGALGGKVPFDSPELAVETTRWRPLLQIDSDDSAGMMWGDVGTLYWLIRDDAISAGTWEDASFTWQCC